MHKKGTKLGALSLLAFAIVLARSTRIKLGVWSNIGTHAQAHVHLRPDLFQISGYAIEERPPTVHLPYAAGISELIRRVCKDFNIRAVFKSGPTLRSLLTKVNDPPLYGRRHL